MLVDTMLHAKQFLHIFVVVETTRTELRTERTVESRRHLVLDFMPDTDQEPQIISRILVDRRVCIVDAPLQLPMLVGA